MVNRDNQPRQQNFATTLGVQNIARPVIDPASSHTRASNQIRKMNEVSLNPQGTWALPATDGCRVRSERQPNMGVTGWSVQAPRAMMPEAQEGCRKFTTSRAPNYF